MARVIDLPAFDPARTAFLLTSATNAFADQADRLPIFQISALLIHAGVPRHHLVVDLPIVPNETVDTPRAHPDCPELHLPAGVFPRHVSQGDAGRPETASGAREWRHVEEFFWVQGADPDVDKLVWVYLNHGKAEGIFFPGLKGLLTIAPEVLANTLWNSVKKPTLIVLDACYSGTFAARVLKEFPAGDRTPVGFLTASDRFARTSAIVLSTELTALLPKKAVLQRETKSQTQLNYRVGHPMFTRGWLREVAYGDLALRLADLPALLNQSDHGFSAQYQANSPQMQNPELRAFFPAPVTPGTGVHGYGEDIQFGDVLLPEKLGELYDDHNPGTWPNVPGGGTPYVLLGSTQLGDLRNRSPTSPAILLKDFMHDDIRDLVKALQEREVRGGERGDGSTSL
jgi:hypothetical protein